MTADWDHICVLVVEDDSNTLAGYLEFLTAAGLTAVGRTNAADALAFSHDSPPDVVVTDIGIPGMDGFELAAALHADERTRAVPVVGITGSWNSDMQIKAVATGLSAMIAKPCVPAHLVAEINRVVRGSRLMAAVLTAMDNTSLRSVAPLPPAGLRNAVLRRRTGG